MKITITDRTLLINVPGSYIDDPPRQACESVSMIKIVAGEEEVDHFVIAEVFEVETLEVLPEPTLQLLLIELPLLARFHDLPDIANLNTVVIFLEVIVKAAEPNLHGHDRVVRQRDEIALTFLEWTFYQDRQRRARLSRARG